MLLTYLQVSNCSIFFDVAIKEYIQYDRQSFSHTYWIHFHQKGSDPTPLCRESPQTKAEDLQH